MVAKKVHKDHLSAFEFGLCGVMSGIIGCQSCRQLTNSNLSIFYCFVQHLYLTRVIKYILVGKDDGSTSIKRECQEFNV